MLPLQFVHPYEVPFLTYAQARGPGQGGGDRGSGRPCGSKGAAVGA